MAINCNYPEAALSSGILFEDNEFHMDEKGPFVLPTNNFINYHGPGNITFKNNKWRVYHDASLRRRLLLTLPSIDFCHPTKGEMFVNFINNDFSVPSGLSSPVYAHLVIINLDFFP